MAKKPAPDNARDLWAIHLDSPDPWRRFERGGAFAQEVERGREQEALWILGDGLALPPDLAGRAFCSAAFQGLSGLCSALASRVQQGGGWMSSTPTAALRDAVHSPYSKASFERSHRPAILAILGGHPQLALDLMARHGPSIAAAESSFALEYGAAALCPRSPGPAKQAALAALRAGAAPAEWARAANFLCVAGGLDAALELLDGVGQFEASRVARAMLSPLCAYVPNDPDKESALIVLERAVELAEGRSERSTAPWSPWEAAYFARPSYSKGKTCSERSEICEKIAARSWGWGGKSMEKAHGVHPRAAAALCGNSQALALLDPLEWTSAEVEALKACSQAVLDVLAKAKDGSSMPTLMGQLDPSHVSAKEGFDPNGWARGAMALFEARSIKLVSKEGMKRAAKAAKRDRKAAGDCGPAEPPAPAAPRRVRL